MVNYVCVTTPADPTLGPCTPRCGSGGQTPLELRTSPSICYSIAMSISGHLPYRNKSLQGRPQLEKAIDELGTGDVLVLA
jgi:hypothetical protein